LFIGTCNIAQPFGFEFVNLFRDGSDETQGALEEVPTEISDEQYNCAVEKLGQERVDEIAAGSQLLTSDYIKAESCFQSMKGYITNIEEATLENSDYRRVLYTSTYSQLVLMNLQPGEEIGAETHELDQFIRIEQGSAQVVLDGVEHELEADYAVVIPAGTRHNVINTGSQELKLYSIYSPPEHKDGTVHPTKGNEVEEHFDGKTTE